ncbi:hypothetical protein ABEB36_003479 [Hypothenemus hampei]|uniref:Calponin-homology (CH) domain-containing protein n=1 Tax=Hypothenemus hampei TaxID=57062 RepID=A0ABD1F998_HYPHA
MSQLTELDASCNQISHFPPRLSELKSLQSLVLRNNLLLVVPIEITYLRLIRLDLRANRISSLPIEIREMDNLIDLLVDENPLTSPPASLCKRGRVHIFKYLETEAMKIASKTGGGTGTLSRKSRKGGAGSPGPPHLANRLKHKRQNVDSGYSTSSDCYEKRWSQELGGEEKPWPLSPILGRTIEQLGGGSSNSTSSTISPAPEHNEDEYDKTDGQRNLKELNNVRLSPFNEPTNVNGNSLDDKPKLQTYREYKEALKQQRAQDVPSIYRTKDHDDQSYKTEPNTPTHQPVISQSMASSRSDPTPLNSAFSSPKHIFDDTIGTKKPVQKVTPSRNISFSPNHSSTNGNSSENNMRLIHDYVKPSSPIKGSSGIVSHDNVPIITSSSVILNGKNNVSNSKTVTNNYVNGSSATSKGTNGMKTSRNISWTNTTASEKMSFTMRREIDKAREETDLINQLRNIIESRLKMALPEDLASALTDGVVLCHLANHIKPRSVASIHVPSPAVPKLTMARCRRNVDNFIEACRKIGVDEGHLCSTLDVTEALHGRGLPRLVTTVEELCRFEEIVHVSETEQGDCNPFSSFSSNENVFVRQPPTWWDTIFSLVLLSVFASTIAFLVTFPPPN